jgi:nitroreductase
MNPGLQLNGCPSNPEVAPRLRYSAGFTETTATATADLLAPHQEEPPLIDNPTLRAIRDRRSVRNFTTDEIDPAHLDAILEAGRWAPSGRNTQPWDFVVVQDPVIRNALGTALKRITFSWGGMAAAPVMIVVSVDESADPRHFIEDGAIAAQNMCLAAESLGLGSAWAGVSRDSSRRGVERSIASLVGLPRTHRIIAIIPIGVAHVVKSTSRRPLAEMVHYDRYAPVPDSRAAAQDERPSGSDDAARGFPTFRSRRSLTEPGKFS